jgi:hypothetical protein
MKKKIILPRRMTFDGYIHGCFLAFLQQKSNFKTIDGGVQIKSGLKFRWMDVPNRTPVVHPYIWKTVVLKHLLKHHYN